MVVLYPVLLLGGLIFFHEWGHYLLARWNGIHVETFSIGFGPKLFGWKGKPRDGMPPTEYVVAALPLGGYVKMLGHDPGDDVPDQMRAGAFGSKTVWQRFTVVAAGPAFNLILPFIIIFFASLFQGKAQSASLGGVNVGGPAWEAGLRPGDVLVGFDDTDVEYWWQVSDYIGTRPDTPMKVRWTRQGIEMSATMTPDTIERVVVAKLNVTKTQGQTGITPNYARPTVHVTPESAAAKAGLRSRDVVLSCNDAPIQRFDNLLAALQQNADGPAVLKVLRYQDRAAAGATLGIATTATVTLPAAEAADSARGILSAEMVIGQVVSGSVAERIGLRVGDRLLTLNGKPLNNWLFFRGALRQDLDADLKFTVHWERAGETMSSAGFQLTEVPAPHKLKKDNTRLTIGLESAAEYAAPPLVENNSRLSFALHESWTVSVEQIWVTFKAIGALFSGDLGTDDMGGPVMIGQMAAQTSEQGWGYFFQLMAFLSINLGLINLLPIPVLDGGQIMFLAIETARRKPVSLRTRQIATYAGMAFIAVLTVIVFKNDIERLITG